MPHHVITLGIKSVGATHIHFVVICLVQDSDIVLAVYLEMHLKTKNKQ